MIKKEKEKRCLYKNCADIFFVRVKDGKTGIHS